MKMTMTRKLVTFKGEDESFKRDGDHQIWVMVPADNVLFEKSILQMPLYFETDGGGRCVIFKSYSKDGIELHAFPIRFDKNDIVLHKEVGDDYKRDLIKDLTGMFYSTNSLLDLEGVDDEY